jgi:OOP family OmpA-OmpF porin
MSKLSIRVFSMLAVAVAVAGCAQRVYEPAPFTPVAIDTTKWAPRVDAFALVLDTSESMNAKGGENFFAAKDVVNQLNRTIPELGYKGSLVTFGPGCMLDKGSPRIWYGPATYRTADLAEALDSVECAGGGTPLQFGLESGGAALPEIPGTVAIIIVSDFREIDVKAAKAKLAGLQAKYGNRVCVHGIQVGAEAAGPAAREEIAGASGCGSSVAASEIATPAAVAAYVERVLLGPPAPRVGDGDGDRDGVPDDLDRCPNTPIGANVNSVGCWWAGSEDVLFDFDKAEIKGTLMLDEAIEILRLNPEISAVVQGHTDNTGDANYNMDLSLRRANAVRDYMISKGFSPSRLRAEGFGESQPHFSNDTAEGRARNRRVTLHPIR